MAEIIENWLTIHQDEAIISIKINEIICISQATDSFLSEITFRTGHKVYTSMSITKIMDAIVQITGGTQKWPSSH